MQTQFFNLNLISLKPSVSTKIIIILFPVIWLSIFYQIVGKFVLNPISPEYFFQFQVLPVSFPSIFLLVNSFYFLQFYGFLLFTLGSSDKLYRMAQFLISLCTESGMLNLYTWARYKPDSSCEGLC